MLTQSLALQLLLPLLSLLNLDLPLEGQDLFRELARVLVEQDGLLEQLLGVVLVWLPEVADGVGRCVLKLSCLRGSRADFLFFGAFHGELFRLKFKNKL